MIPLPTHPEIHTYRWTALELRAIEQWGREVEAAARRQALEEAAQAVESIPTHQWVDGSDQYGRPCPAKVVASKTDYLRAIRSLIDKEATHG